MPTVPMYNQRQVQSAALPAGGVSVQTSPDTFGAGFGEFGQRVAGLFAEHQEKANVALSQDALLQFQQFADDQMNNPETGLMTKQGKNAIGQADATMNNIRGKADELMQQVPEAMRKNFLQQVNQYGMQYKNQASRYEIGQVQQYETGQFQGILTNGAQNVAKMYGDNRAYVDGNRQIFDQIEQFGFAHGWSVEQIQAKKVEFKETVADSALSQWSASNAMAFIESNGELSDTVAGSRRATVNPYGGEPQTTKGMVTQGNINLFNRPSVKNDDGTISTVRTISIGTDAGEVLIPTVSDDGKLLSDDQAIALYEKTGKHLGVFDNPDDATSYAEKLHDQQDEYYVRGGAGSESRGLRNNNPGNLEYSKSNPWSGQNGSDGRFAKFETPEHGIRALGRNLLSYQRQGFDTVSEIINRWAPPKENKTDKYIEAVCDQLRIAPDQPIDASNPDTLKALCAAIIHHENGGQPYSDQELSGGVSAALGLTALPETGKRYTGNAAFDAASPQAQAAFLRQADQQRKQQQAAYQVQMDMAVKDTYSALDEGLRPQQPPSQTDFLNAYGPAKGIRKWQDMQAQQAYGGVIAAAKDMTPGARQALLENSRPTDANDPNFAANQQRWDKMKNKFSELDKEWEKNQGRVMVGNAINNGVAMDPSNKSNRDAADSYFDSQFSNFNINNNDDVNAVTGFISRTGIIPTRLASQLNAASAVKDPAIAIPAAELVSRIYDANPVALNSMPNEKQSFYLNAKRLKDAGVNAESAIDQAYNLAYNQTDALKAQLASEQGTSSYKKDRLSAASDFVSDRSQFFRRDPSADDTNAEAARFRQDYQSLYDLNYRVSGGDADIAKKMTSQQISRTWSISEVNGSAQLMKYAPEALYQGGPSGWQAQQWEKERNNLVYGIEDIPAASAAGGGIGRVSTADTSRPEPKVKGDVILVPDVSTPRNGDYAIMISEKDKDGVPTLQPYYDANGRPLRYRPDLESWKPYQDLLNDQKTEADQTMQKAQERRGFYDAHREFDDQYQEGHEQRIETQKTQLQNYFKWGKE